MTEEEIILKLKSDADAHNKALAFIYAEDSYKGPVMALLRSKGLPVDDCNILWTDTVVKFGLLVKKNKYQHQNKLVGYLKNLAGYMFLNYIRDNKKYKSEDIELTLIKDHYIESNVMHNKELKSLFDEQLSLLGESCKSILYLWAQDYSMDEIMKKMDIISVEATRKRKHICLKKLLEHISTNQNLIKLFEPYYYE